MAASNRCQASLAHRILDCFPSGSYALGTLLRLVDIVETDRVETAAVECRAQPRMLINPLFVEQWASTPENLLMLVMHELHHVLLGHTRLLRRVSAVDNLVFDAVINAMLCRMFPEREYTSFFTGLYSDRKFPECLLRPPTRFRPDKITATPPALQSSERSRIANVYRALYSEIGATYEELYDIFTHGISEDQAEAVVLMGDHDKTDGSTSGGLEASSKVLFDAVRGIVEHWPQPPDPIRGRSLESLIRESTVRPTRRMSNRQTLRALLRRIADVEGPGRSTRVEAEETATVQVPVPSLDRTSTVLRALGIRPLLYSGQIPTSRRVRNGQKVHVYLDVSGSIGDLKNALYGAVLDCRQLVHPSIHLFSTKVVEASLADIKRGRCVSTYGTNIACVAKHIHKNKIRRAVIITDGFVGRPRGRVAECLSAARFGVALTPGNTTRDDLEGFADHWTQLYAG